MIGDCSQISDQHVWLSCNWGLIYSPLTCQLLALSHIALVWLLPMFFTRGLNALKAREIVFRLKRFGDVGKTMGLRALLTLHWNSFWSLWLEVAAFPKREECEGGLQKNCERNPGLNDVLRSIGLGNCWAINSSSTTIKVLSLQLLSLPRIGPSFPLEVLTFLKRKECEGKVHDKYKDKWN